MAVDAIGGTVGSGVGAVQSEGLQTQDFLKLFLTQLSFQDPLNPVDNSQFLAQLAQFTNIEQVQVLSDNIAGLLSQEASSQAIALLGRTISVQQTDKETIGEVGTVTYVNGEPELTLKTTDGSLVQGIKLSQISVVQ